MKNQIKRLWNKNIQIRNKEKLINIHRVRRQSSERRKYLRVELEGISYRNGSLSGFIDW